MYVFVCGVGVAWVMEFCSFFCVGFLVVVCQ